MKAGYRHFRINPARAGIPFANQRAYWAAIGLASLACGTAAMAQTTTNAPAANSGSSTNVTKLEDVVVVGKLDEARSQILPNLGATAYTISKTQIESLPGGDNAPMNEIILHAPGVAQDSAVNGDLHVRGEHANLQYRINDVLLPEGIAGFGLELDARFVESMQLITGSLPAEYGFRTAGIVDIKTKSGAFENGGEAEFYGGSYDTYRPSFEYGGTEGKFSYFIDGSYEHTGLGIENPSPTSNPIHDDSDQGRMFSYMSWLIDDTSRVSLMLSASDSNFQVPNTATNNAPALPGIAGANGIPATLNSASLNERQNEQNYYAVATYQKSVDNLNLQASVFGRNSDQHFMPDPIGDLYFNGVASEVKRDLYSGGLQADGSYEINDKHTLRFGVLAIDEAVSGHTTTTVFDTDINGNVVGSPFALTDNHVLHGLFAGLYLQDEWTLFPKLTVNYGARMDWFAASFDHENQLSPRVNLIYKPVEATTLHAGYARYFTPPPIENVSGSDIALFNGTSNASANPQDDPVKAERANYFDAGISQQLAPGLTVGVDGYYKLAKNQLDDGLFGQTLILSAFNYAKGDVHGVEFTGSYAKGGFSTYANLALSKAEGKDWNSAQFLFDPTDAAYVQNHWIHLDHDQTISGSFGASYLMPESIGSTRVYVDAIYGSGLRNDAVEDGVTIPNGGTVPSYYSVGVGAEQVFKVGKKQSLKARLDVVNVTDNSYELRDGSGVGVNAAQFGERIGFFGSVSYRF